MSAPPLESVVRPFLDFRTATGAVLEYLHRRVGFDLWMLARVAGTEWIVLQAEDHGYGIADGATFKWADTFCASMIAGRGPRIAPRSSECPAYAHAAIGREIRIGAYVGFPLAREDGSLFGTLCAVHPAPQPEQILQEAPTIELLARLLATHVNFELRDVDRARRERRAAAHEDGHEDPSTGLLDRRAWGQLLEAEQRVCERLGETACVVLVHVNQAKVMTLWGGPPQTEEVLRRATRLLAGVTRPADVAARVGRYDLGILMCDCDPVDLASLGGRLGSAFDAGRIDVSIGTAHRKPREALTETWRRAERRAGGRNDATPGG